MILLDTRAESNDFRNDAYVCFPVTCPDGAGFTRFVVTVNPGFVPNKTIVTVWLSVFGSDTVYTLEILI